MALHNFHDSQITFARGNAGQTLCINDVPSGLACQCICFACGGTMVARKGKVKMWHFAHHTSALTECQWAVETALHMAMKDIIELERRIFLPGLDLTVQGKTSKGEAITKSYQSSGKLVSLDSVLLEYSVNPIRPDVVATTTGKRLFIEVTVTHGPDAKKRSHLQRIGTSAVEFDLRNHPRSVDRDELRYLLLEPSSTKKWIFNAKSAEIEAQLKIELQAAIAEREAHYKAQAIIQHELESKRLKQLTESHAWAESRQNADAALQTKMRFEGSAICFGLRDGGEIFMHTRPDGEMWLDITEGALWILPELHGAPMEKRSGELFWRAPKDQRLNLIPTLNLLTSFTRNVDKHAYKRVAP